MTKDKLVTVPPGTTLEEAKKHLHEHRIEKLLVVDDAYALKGLITIKDIEKVRKYPNACKDSFGRLRVGAAIGVGHIGDVSLCHADVAASHPVQNAGGEQDPECVGETQ